MKIFILIFILTIQSSFAENITQCGTYELSGIYKCKKNGCSLLINNGSRSELLIVVQEKGIAYDLEVNHMIRAKFNVQKSRDKKGWIASAMDIAPQRILFKPGVSGIRPIELKSCN